MHKIGRNLPIFFIYQETPGKEDTGLPQSGDEWNRSEPDERS